MSGQAVSVFGSTGMVGSAVIAELADRDQSVTGYNRTGKVDQPVPSVDYAQGDLNDTESAVKIINDSSVTVLATSPRGADDAAEKMIQAHKDLIAAAPTGRIVVIVGAGSLQVDGTNLVDTPEFPDEYKQEALTLGTVLDLYRQSSGLNWTAISPSPEIAPGPRGDYVIATDSPAGDFVSTGTFARGIVDELLTPDHQNERFTIANAPQKA